MRLFKFKKNESEWIDYSVFNSEFRNLKKDIKYTWVEKNREWVTKFNELYKKIENLNGHNYTNDQKNIMFSRNKKDIIMFNDKKNTWTERIISFKRERKTKISNQNIWCMIVDPLLWLLEMKNERDEIIDLFDNNKNIRYKWWDLILTLSLQERPLKNWNSDVSQMFQVELLYWWIREIIWVSKDEVKRIIQYFYNKIDEIWKG